MDIISFDYSGKVAKVKTLEMVDLGSQKADNIAKRFFKFAGITSSSAHSRQPRYWNSLTAFVTGVAGIGGGLVLAGIFVALAPNLVHLSKESAEIIGGSAMFGGIVLFLPKALNVGAHLLEKGAKPSPSQSSEEGSPPTLTPSSLVIEPAGYDDDGIPYYNIPFDEWKNVINAGGKLFRNGVAPTS